MRVRFIQFVRRAIAIILRRAAAFVWQDRSLYEANGNRPFNLNGWDHIPENQYDYTPKGTHVSGLASQFLLVPKNRYRLVLLPDQRITLNLTGRLLRRLQAGPGGRVQLRLSPQALHIMPRK